MIHPLCNSSDTVRILPRKLLAQLQCCMFLCRKNISKWLGSWFRMPFDVKPEVLVTDWSQWKVPSAVNGFRIFSNIMLNKHKRIQNCFELLIPCIHFLSLPNPDCHVLKHGKMVLRGQRVTTTCVRNKTQPTFFLLFADCRQK